MIGYAKKIEKIIRESAFDKKKKKPGLKFRPQVSANRCSNNWAQGPKISSLDRVAKCMICV